MAHFPLLYAPAIYGLDDRPANPDRRIRGWRSITAVRTGEERSMAKALGVDEVRVEVPVYPASFMRMLAKIAWGYTVATFGLDAVEPGILGVILGTDDRLDLWVGCPVDGSSMWTEAPTTTFRVTVYNNDLGGVIAGIQLFGPQGGPEYQVAVGVLREALAPGQAALE